MSTTEIRNAEHAKILAHYAVGDGIADIARDLELGHDYVGGVVQSLANFDRGRAKQLVQAFEQRRRAVAAANGKPVAPEFRPAATAPPEPEVAPDLEEEEPVDELDDVEALLLRAESSTVAKARTMAGKIRALLAELLALVEQTRAEEEARARVAALQAQLDTARAALREARGVARPEPAATAGGDEVRASTVRAWCRANGVEVSPIGRVNQSARDAYDKAHGEAS